MSDDILAALNPAGADLILKSSDGQRFPVHKAIVCHASLTLKEFPFDVSPYAEDTDGRLPIVPFLENAQTIENLLRLIYPIPPPAFHTLSEVYAVLEIGRKYQVDIVLTRVGHMLLADRTFLERQPIGVFALARGYGMPAVAHRAARSVLLLSEMKEKEPRVLAKMSAEEFYRLDEYRKECIQATKDALGTRALRTLLQNNKRWTWVSCNEKDDVCKTSSMGIGGLTKRPHNTAFVRKWWWAYIDDLRAAMGTQSATSAALDDVGILAKACKLAAVCPTCSERMHEDLAEFVQVMKDDVERRIAAVQLKLE